MPSGNQVSSMIRYCLRSVRHVGARRFYEYFLTNLRADINLLPSVFSVFIVVTCEEISCHLLQALHSRIKRSMICNLCWRISSRRHMYQTIVFIRGSFSDRQCPCCAIGHFRLVQERKNIEVERTKLHFSLFVQLVSQLRPCSFLA